MLKIEGLSCAYGNKTVVSNVSFEAKRREIVGIIGPNGSGKSTILRSIIGDIVPQSGTISLDERDLMQMSIRKKSTIVSFVPQTIEQLQIRVIDYVLMGRMPVRPMFQLFTSKNDENIVMQLMQEIGIEHLAQKLMNEISGGERQLAAIARALSQQPQLLLLDEPTSNLDIANQTAILQTIYNLAQRQDIIVVIVLHDINLASEYCNNILLIKNGIKHNFGAPQHIITKQNIDKVYETSVLLTINPNSKRPAILLSRSMTQ